MASQKLRLLFGFFLLLLAIQLQIDALRILPQQQIQEAQERRRDAAMKESFVQQYFQSQNLPVREATYSKPNTIMPEEVGLEALNANKKSDIACEEKKKKEKEKKKKEKEKKKKNKCEKKKPKKKPPCRGEGKAEETITTD